MDTVHSADIDSELTAHALAGQRDAFAQIVTRYQSLVCSLAYSATGSLSQSEDLAQEVFIAAWKGLRTLREPEKLRSWLCGIARNIIANAMRNRRQEPTVAAESLDAVQAQASPEMLPVERVISSEEESILWRSLEHIPEVYREPLVLFYREGQSIESVSEKLELSEEAVKQRLSRGRKLLKMEVASFVESALGRSAPGRGFTAAVLAGIPELSMPVGASSVGIALSKGSAAAKAGSFAAFIAGMLAPLLAAIGAFLVPIGAIKIARSEPEKALLKRGFAVFLAIFVIGLSAALLLNDDQVSSVIISTTIVAMMLTCIAIGLLKKRLREKMRIAEAQLDEKTQAGQPFGSTDSPGYKWNLYASLLAYIFGSPLGFLTAWAASAHDSKAVFAILAILVAAFVLIRRILIQNPEQAPNVWRAVCLTQFVLLMLVLHLRWDLWKEQSPRNASGYMVMLIAISFLLFAFALIHWLMKRNRKATTANKSL